MIGGCNTHKIDSQLRVKLAQPNYNLTINFDSVGMWVCFVCACVCMCVRMLLCVHDGVGK